MRENHDRTVVDEANTIHAKRAQDITKYPGSIRPWVFYLRGSAVYSGGLVVDYVKKCVIC